jgi:serine O-acetyltransferase
MRYGEGMARWIERVAAAAGKLSRDVREDHEAMNLFNSKYDPRRRPAAPISKDLVEKIGFQFIAACRVMRFFKDVDAALPARITSRMIRHLYGSDVHWDAEIAPGIVVVHGMGMAISHQAAIGPRVLLFQGCTLGVGRHPDTGEVGAPTLEEGVVVGAGAQVIGPITIGARSKIMPGCVVVRSVPADSLVESPAPAVRARRGRSREIDGQDGADARTGARS